MAYYDYAPDCGCGNRRCNNGWIYWNGSEYPCSACQKKAEQKKDEEEQAGE